MKTLTHMLVAAVLAVAGPAAAGELEFGGFVDASYVYDLNTEGDEFGLDQVELDVSQQVSDATAVRADVEWAKDGEDFIAAVEQAFVAHTIKRDITFTFGKFNAPIGFELLDAPDLYQFSHSLVFEYGLPTNLTGLMVSGDLSDSVDIAAYVVNGWDRNADGGKNLTAGARLGLARGGFSGGLSFIGGKETWDVDYPYRDTGNAMGTGTGERFETVTRGYLNASLTRRVFDIDVGVRTGSWTFGGEVNHGTAKVGGLDDQSWTALMGMGHYDFNETFGLTGRLEYFDDADGYVFGRIGGETQTRQEVTIAPTFAVDDGLGALFEVRVDKSDRDAWIDGDGEPTDIQTTVAFEVTHSW